MYEFKSPLLTVISLFIFIRVDFTIASSYQCQLPPLISVGSFNQNQDIEDYYQTKLTVDVPDHGFWIFTYPESRTITFGLDNVTINFNGNVVYYTPGHNLQPPVPVSQIFQYRLSGVAQRIQMNSTDSDISDCHVFLLTNRLDSTSSKIEETIPHFAEPCVQSAICLRIGKLGMLYKVGNPNLSGLAKLPGLTGPMSYAGSFYGPLPLQNAINSLMDSGLAILVEGFKASGRKRISVPKIDRYFTATRDNLKTEGHFEATNGVFSDLTNLRRSSSPSLFHDGMKFIISCQFTINSAKLHYKYRLSYKSQKSKGIMTVTIDAVNFETRFIADYSNKPCLTTLDYIQVTNFENVNSDFTYNGPLESLIEKRNWIDEKTTADIAQVLESYLRHSVAFTTPGLWAFDCERFRP